MSTFPENVTGDETDVAAMRTPPKKNVRYVCVWVCVWLFSDTNRQACHKCDVRVPAPLRRCASCGEGPANRTTRATATKAILCSSLDLLLGVQSQMCGCGGVRFANKYKCVY